MPKSKKKNTKKKRYSVEPGLLTAEAWQQFQTALEASLNGLGEDEYLIISVKETHHFVQFAGQGGFGMRAEARSNTFIEEKWLKLKKRARQHLVKLGWKKPTYVPSSEVAEPSDGSPNYYIDAAPPVSYATLAALAVDSLREVYGVRFPGELEHVSFSQSGTSIRFPMLSIRRREEVKNVPGAGFASALEEMEDDLESEEDWFADE